LIDTYKTPTNTIKLAIKCGLGNADFGNTNINISGFGMSVVGNTSYVNTSAFTMDNQVNAGAQIPWGGQTGNATYLVIPAGGATPTPQNNIRIGIPGIDKDVFMTVVSPCDLQGYEMRGVRFTILSGGTGNLPLGSPKPTQVSPLARACNSDSGSVGRGMGGFIISANVLAAKAVRPVNSGVWYLDFRIENYETAIQYLNSILVETVN
jgi:hypothetical protein